MSLDPLAMTRDDIEAIVIELKKQRQNWIAPKSGKPSPQVSLTDLDISF